LNGQGWHGWGCREGLARVGELFLPSEPYKLAAKQSRSQHHHKATDLSVLFSLSEPILGQF
jgi:hypothetical protein